MKLVKACAIMLGFMSSNPATFLANAADDTMIQQGEREVQVTASGGITIVNLDAKIVTATGNSEGKRRRLTPAGKSMKSAKSTKSTKSKSTKSMKSAKTEPPVAAPVADPTVSPVQPTARPTVYNA